MKGIQNPEQASIEVAQLHGHQVDPTTVGNGPLGYVSGLQNDWNLEVPDKDYLQPVAETIWLLEQNGYEVETFISVDDTYPQKSQLEFNEGQFTDKLDDGIVDQYVQTIVGNAGDIESELIGDATDIPSAVQPTTVVWESELGQETYKELMNHDGILVFGKDEGGKKGWPEKWGIWDKDNKAYLFEKGQAPVDPKIGDDTPPGEAYSQTKAYGFTCPLAHVGYGLEMTGQLDNTDVPAGDIGISFSQNWFSSPSSMDKKAEQIMQILEQPGEGVDGPYDFSDTYMFEAPNVTGEEVVENVLN